MLAESTIILCKLPTVRDAKSRFTEEQVDLHRRMLVVREELFAKKFINISLTKTET